MAAVFAYAVLVAACSSPPPSDRGEAPAEGTSATRRGSTSGDPVLEQENGEEQPLVGSAPDASTTDARGGSDAGDAGAKPSMKDELAACCAVVRARPAPENDNFCHALPGTAACPMTLPGGYCDKNGDKSYTDADWVRGYDEFRTYCR